MIVEGTFFGGKMQVSLILFALLGCNGQSLVHDNSPMRDTTVDGVAPMVVLDTASGALGLGEAFVAHANDHDQPPHTLEVFCRLSVLVY